MWADYLGFKPSQRNSLTPQRDNGLYFDNKKHVYNFDV
jgi:hypothetical protein